MQTNPENESFCIKQKKFLCREQSFRVIEDRIEYSSKGMFSINNFSMPLKALEPQPLRYRTIPVGWFLGLIILLLFNAGIIALIFASLASNKVDSISQGIFVFFVLSVLSYLWQRKPLTTG